MTTLNGLSEEQFSKLIHESFYPTLPYRSVKKDYRSKKNVNKSLCKKCQGKCCKTCGCHFSPDDFKEISFDYLKSELEKGYISIDVVLGEAIYSSYDTYILRTRNQEAPIVDLRLNRRKERCIFLTDEGCKLEYNHRPSGGRLLVPRYNEQTQDFICFSSYDIRACCYEWLPHKELLQELINYFSDKDFPCSL